MFEILFGITDPHEPALADIERLRLEFPALPMRVVFVRTDAPNPKVCVLSELARHARHALLVVNDSDILVEPGYFRSVVAPLEDPRTGLVTCLYRAQARSLAARSEALGIATEFAPSVLVARLLGVVEFALGATMALRAETLREIGGFEPIAEFLADDYQLGRRVTAGGYRVEFARTIVETGLGGGLLGRGLAAPVAMVAHHPCFAPRGLFRFGGDAGHLMGSGGLRRAPMVGGRRGTGVAPGGRLSGGRSRPPRSPCLPLVLADAVARSLRPGGMAGRMLRIDCLLARQEAAPSRGRPHYAT